MRRRQALQSIAATAALPALPINTLAALNPDFPPPIKGQPPFILKQYLSTRRAWDIFTQIQILPYLRVSSERAPNYIGLQSDRLAFEKLVITSPIAPITGLSHPDERTIITGKVTSEAKPYAGNPRLSDPYALGTKLAIFNGGRTITTNLRVSLNNQIVSYDTDIDDKQATRSPWPDSFTIDDDDLSEREVQLNNAVTTALQPQQFIESDSEFINKLLNAWTAGNPRKLTPYALVKYIASRVFLQYRPDNARFLSVDRKFPTHVSPLSVQGLRVLGADYAAQVKDGSPFDFINLLVALLRAAGIPTRPVIGIDIQAQDSTSQEDSFKGDLSRIHAWLEFFHRQPGQRVGQWIPFDALRLRRRSERTPPLDRKWDFLGYLREGRFYAPVSCHWHPPTAVVSPGPPSLWGWIPDTADDVLPAIEQRLVIRANPAEQRGDSPPIPTPPMP